MDRRASRDDLVLPFEVADADGRGHVLEVWRKALDDARTVGRILDALDVPRRLRQLAAGEMLVVAGVKPEDADVENRGG